MKKSYLYVLGIVLIAVLLYLFLPYKNVNSSKTTYDSNNFSFESYSDHIIDNLPDSSQEMVNNLIELTQSDDDSQRINGFTQLISKYNDLEKPILAAWSVYNKAKTINHTNSWEITGDNFISLLTSQSLDSNIRANVAQLATESFENSYQLDSSNTSSRMKMAQCYMELENQPMKGVQELLSIVRSDENNVDAQLLLSKFGLISGQYEKVKGRLGKVLSLQPQNIDALLMRADMYSSTGDLGKAISDLKTVKNLPSIPEEMKIKIEESIAELGKKK